MPAWTALEYNVSAPLKTGLYFLARFAFDADSETIYGNGRYYVSFASSKGNQIFLVYRNETRWHQARDPSDTRLDCHGRVQLADEIFHINDPARPGALDAPTAAGGLALDPALAAGDLRLDDQPHGSWANFTLNRSVLVTGQPRGTFLCAPPFRPDMMVQLHHSNVTALQSDGTHPSLDERLVLPIVSGFAAMALVLLVLHLVFNITVAMFHGISSLLTPLNMLFTVGLLLEFSGAVLSGVHAGGVRLTGIAEPSTEGAARSIELISQVVLFALLLLIAHGWPEPTPPPPELMRPGLLSSGAGDGADMHGSGGPGGFKRSASDHSIMDYLHGGSYYGATDAELAGLGHGGSAKPKKRWFNCTPLMSVGISVGLYSSLCMGLFLMQFLSAAGGGGGGTVEDTGISVFQTLAGSLLLTARCILYLQFLAAALRALRQSYRRSPRALFFRNITIFFSVWFLSMPVAAVILACVPLLYRETIFTFHMFCLDVVAFYVLFILFAPISSLLTDRLGNVERALLRHIEHHSSTTTQGGLSAGAASLNHAGPGPGGVATDGTASMRTSTSSAISIYSDHFPLPGGGPAGAGHGPGGADASSAGDLDDFRFSPLHGLPTDPLFPMDDDLGPGARASVHRSSHRPNSASTFLANNSSLSTVEALALALLTLSSKSLSSAISAIGTEYRAQMAILPLAGETPWSRRRAAPLFLRGTVALASLGLDEARMALKAHKSRHGPKSSSGAGAGAGAGALADGSGPGPGKGGRSHGGGGGRTAGQQGPGLADSMHPHDRQAFEALGAMDALGGPILSAEGTSLLPAGPTGGRAPGPEPPPQSALGSLLSRMSVALFGPVPGGTDPAVVSDGGAFLDDPHYQHHHHHHHHHQHPAGDYEPYTGEHSPLAASHTGDYLPPFAHDGHHHHHASQPFSF
ncbi:hypothetical protein H696_05648 [Fonticula alba]|uniref:GPR180/TMEM145 transmembrane domain-containing protein n=1 Tax=Fonticula alba TaxID=691883 RepID=A0A058Z1B9_FONAL|nr:hypothetical protein H696_05648 [Fonticula alba]KCV67921.1 hypothetical protein H696_05648 [Fonticula alba]|eukprot:XP_009497741.1 hypothetical protein H696_05648 [Fonticula alba]